jgi:3-oxoadipate enol-lactonase
VDGFVGCAAALADHDFRPEVSAVPLPVLFLVGEKDGATPAAMRQLQTDLPGSRFIELSGAGHISNLDRPDAFNRAVEDFLRGAAN